MLYSVITTRPIAKPAPVQNTVTTTEVPVQYESDLYDLPMYYYNPVGFLVYVIVYILWIIVWAAIYLGLFFGGIFLIILLLKNKKIKCPSCGKTNRYMKKKPKYCSKCGAELEGDIQFSKIRNGSFK